jgi:hypothetical protein
MSGRAARALRALAVASLLVVAGALGTAAAAPASAAGRDVAAAAPAAAPTVTDAADPAARLPVEHGDELGNSSPKANSGTKPQDPGDPGGSAQVTLFYVLLAGTVFIAIMITREVRKGRRRQEAAAASRS